MQNETERADDRRSTGIRKIVWLLILGPALVGIIAVRFSRTDLTKGAAVPSPNDSSTTQHSSFTIAKRNAASATTEPVHQGRLLREWIEDLKDGDFKTKETARDALIAIGPPAIPALAKVLDDFRAMNWAAFALAGIGKDALPVLLDALANGPLLTRQEIASAGVMQTHALLPYEDEIVPVLIECMRNEDAGVRGGAVNALQSYWKRPDIVMPSLMDCLTDSNTGVRGSAVTVIRKFGHDAEPAVPILVRLATKDPDAYVRTRAAESLRMVAPRRADQEGL